MNKTYKISFSSMSSKNLVFFLFFLFGACSSDYSPKPVGYFYIHIDAHDYRTFSNYSPFEFAVSTQVKEKKIPSIETEKLHIQNGIQSSERKWFNLIYPALNAQIYCDYLPISLKNFAQISEESRKFAYLHAIKADAIQECVYKNSAQKVYGIVYEIKGNVASPVQFVLTDSVKHFFRGALYFDNVPNQDSIAPVLKYISEDIDTLIESFKWKK